ncbi:MAG TPA: hypothetical protein V6D08_17215 [Candidatus Obscuribacterales bacterium]
MFVGTINAIGMGPGDRLQAGARAAIILSDDRSVAGGLFNQYAYGQSYLVLMRRRRP